MDQERGRLSRRGREPRHDSHAVPAIVSALPPRQCGIATFAASRCAAIRKTDAPVHLELVAIERLTGVDGAAAMFVGGSSRETLRASSKWRTP